MKLTKTWSAKTKEITLTVNGMIVKYKRSMRKACVDRAMVRMIRENDPFLRSNSKRTRLQ